jgi:hypothetical protein
MVVELFVGIQITSVAICHPQNSTSSYFARANTPNQTFKKLQVKLFLNQTYFIM